MEEALEPPAPATTGTLRSSSPLGNSSGAPRPDLLPKFRSFWGLGYAHRSSSYPACCFGPARTLPTSSDNFGEAVRIHNAPELPPRVSHGGAGTGARQSAARPGDDATPSCWAAVVSDECNSLLVGSRSYEFLRFHLSNWLGPEASSETVIPISNLAE